MAIAPRVIDLSLLTPAVGFIIQGDRPGDYAGRSVASAGDVNGDGIDDLIVGAPSGDNGGTDAGEAYVIFGSTGVRCANIDLTRLAAADGFILQGDRPGDRAGYSVASAGDVNGDGIDDLIVGAPLSDNGGTNAGEAYVIFGSTGTTRANIDLTTLTATDGFILQGDSAGDQAGYSVASAGDVNGDGIDDLIVGARFGDIGDDFAGEAYVIFGSTGTTRANIDLTTLAAADGFIIQGDSARDLAGYSVASAGDVNGDGVDDLIVGAPYGDFYGYDTGEAYVIFGRAGTTRANIDLGALAAADGFIIQGDRVGDRAGCSVASAGDVNGDEIDDLIVGASSAGEAYVIYGSAGTTRANIELETLAAADGFNIRGASDRAGWRVASAGDVNGDRIDDLIVGAPNDNYFAGAAYVIFGRTGTTRANIDLTTTQAAADGFIIRGASAGDRAGTSVASAGDVNGDGIDDLIVGARFAGEAYVIYGSATIGLGGDITGDAGANTLTGTIVGERLFGLSGKDRLFGGEGNDRLLGGRGSDHLFGGQGSDTLSGGLGRDRMTGNQDADTFLFRSVSESGASRTNADVITDFNAHAVDLIDLRGLGALNFIGTAGFTAAGQLRYEILGGTTYVEVNTAGAGAPEMTIALTGAITLGADDFLLA